MEAFNDRDGSRPPRIDLSDEALGRLVKIFLSGVLLSR